MLFKDILENKEDKRKHTEIKKKNKSKSSIIEDRDE